MITTITILKINIIIVIIIIIGSWSGCKIRAAGTVPLNPMTACSSSSAFGKGNIEQRMTCINKYIYIYIYNVKLIAYTIVQHISKYSGVNTRESIEVSILRRVAYGGDHAKNEDSKRQESREHRTAPFSGISPKTTLVLSLTSIDSRKYCGVGMLDTIFLKHLGVLWSKPSRFLCRPQINSTSHNPCIQIL